MQPKARSLHVDVRDISPLDSEMQTKQTVFQESIKSSVTSQLQYLMHFLARYIHDLYAV